MTRSTRRRLLVSVGLAIGVGCLLTLAYWLTLFSTIQLQLQDVILFRVPQSASARATVVVGIDERSLQALLPRYGTLLAWPRALYAQALDSLRQASPRVVVLDRIFDTPTPDDAELGAAIKRAGNVVLAVEASVPGPGQPVPGVAQEFTTFVRSVEPIRQSAVAEGVANVHVDRDGVVRSMPLILRAAGEDLPALPLTTVSRFLRRRAVLDGPPTADGVPSSARIVPVDRDGNLQIRFLGPPSSTERGGPIPMIPFIDVLNGQFDRGLVNDKIVLLGVTLAGLDTVATPTSGRVPMWGVEVLASATETILGNRYLTQAAPLVTVGLVFALALGAALLVALRRPIFAAVGALGLLGLYLLAAVTVVDSGLILNLVYPPAALLLSFLVVLLYRVIFEQSEQRVIRGVMARYLSPSVSQWVLHDPERLRLGGETRDMTVLFSDVRGFTTLSHALDPQALVALLNEYMTAMTEVVFVHDGVLDKYIGDAIMAFWNAPMDQADHAQRACATALDMIARLRELQKDWELRGLPRLELGVGINTGPMVVGNMGSRQRLAYTVLGDTVNVASRLEGLSKEYGTRVVIGEATRRATGDAFDYRFLDVVAVKGRSEPLAVYEVIGRSGQVPSERAAFLASYQEGIELYRSRRFGEALERFERLAAEDPDDGPTRLYRHRAEELVQDPPPPDWDGVFVAKTK